MQAATPNPEYFLQPALLSGLVVKSISCIAHRLRAKFIHLRASHKTAHGLSPPEVRLLVLSIVPNDVADVWTSIFYSKKIMKIPKNTYSFAHAAHELQFPGGPLNFIFWLRHHEYLSGDLRPHQMCLNLGFFVDHTQEIPGATRDQIDQVVIPRITAKGLQYFRSTFDRDTYTVLNLTSPSDSLS